MSTSDRHPIEDDKIVRTSMNDESNVICKRCGINISPKRISGLCEKCYEYEYNKKYIATHKSEVKNYRQEYSKRPKIIPAGRTIMLCTRCITEKALIEFHPGDRHRSKSICKSCKKLRSKKYNANKLAKYHSNPEPTRRRNRERALRPEFKLHRRLKRINATMQEFEEAVKRSKGICENPNCGNTYEVFDHKEGVSGLRGLLCHTCNTALGLLYESSEVILGLVEYLNTRIKG